MSNYDSYFNISYYILQHIIIFFIIIFCHYLLTFITAIETIVIMNNKNGEYYGKEQTWLKAS